MKPTRKSIVDFERAKANYLKVFPNASEDALKELEKSIQTCLLPLRYHDYFRFLNKLLELDVVKNNSAATAIINKLRGSNCFFKRTKFTAGGIISYLNARIHFCVYEDSNSIFNAYIGGKQFSSAEEIKWAMNKIYAEYEYVPIFISPEIENIYMEYLKGENHEKYLE